MRSRDIAQSACKRSLLGDERRQRERRERVLQQPSRGIVAVGPLSALISIHRHPIEIVRIAASQELIDSMTIDQTHLLADVIPSARYQITKHQQSIVILLMNEMIRLTKINNSLRRKSHVERNKPFKIALRPDRKLKPNRMLRRPRPEFREFAVVGE